MRCDCYDGLSMTGWPVFICYRQTDGMEAARRVYELLHGSSVPLPAESDARERLPLIDAYFDQAAPGVEDWTRFHEPHLKRARAIIVICTPGAKLNEGESDWVHREIDWWLENRESAPILVDPLGAEDRYVPEAIAERWPNAQRIKLLAQDWDGLGREEHHRLDERVRARFLGAVVPSAETIYEQELRHERQRAQRLRRALRMLLALSAVVVTTLLVALWAYTGKRASDKEKSRALEARDKFAELTQAARAAEAQATELRRQAEGAFRREQARVVERQAAQARSEAALLEQLRRSGQFGDYSETILQWERELRRRADSLAELADGETPECDSVAAFSIYEQELVEVFLDDEPSKALFAYLATVPGSSPRPNDWAPAVVDLFFADDDAVRIGKNRSREDVRAAIDSVAADRYWPLLVGLGTVHGFNLDAVNYRLTRKGLNMNDEGDMIMFFEVCRELDPPA